MNIIIIGKIYIIFFIWGLLSADPINFCWKKDTAPFKTGNTKNGSGSGNFNHKNDESAGIIPLLKTPNKANNIGSWSNSGKHPPNGFT